MHGGSMPKISRFILDAIASIQDLARVKGCRFTMGCPQAIVSGRNAATVSVRPVSN